jgi:hypothetical protein
LQHTREHLRLFRALAVDQKHGSNSVKALIRDDVEAKGSVVSAAAWASGATARTRVQRGILAVKRSFVEREIDVVRDPR